MSDLVEIARLREFIDHKGLATEFRAFVAEHDRRVAASAEPALEVACEFMSGRSEEERVNVTPWLREASFEDACRFARLVRDEHDEYDPDDEDVKFLSRALEPCLDEEQTDRFDRAHAVRVMLYDVLGLHAKVRRLMPAIRPADHERVIGHLVGNKGPMGPGEPGVAEEAETLL